MYQLCKEPDARKPHVRICGGQVSQGACLPDTVGLDGLVYSVRFGGFY